MRPMKLASVVLTAMVVIACSPVTPEPQATPEQQALSDAVCGQVMGIWSGDVYYGRCQESVVGVLADRTKRQAMLLAYRDCAREDSDVNSAARSACVLRSMSGSIPPAPLKIATSTDPDTSPGIRFDYISLPTQLNRERYACSELGLFPGSGPFDGCVASLQDALIPNKY